MITLQDIIEYFVMIIFLYASSMISIPVLCVNMNMTKYILW